MGVTTATGFATFDVVVGGLGRPLEITSLGPVGAAFGARPNLRASVATAGVGGQLVANRPITFAVAGHTANAVTDAGGVAAAEVLVDFAPGVYPLTITAPALPGEPRARRS